MARGLRIQAKLITRNAYRDLARIRNLGEDLGPILGIWGAIIEASVRRRFDTGRGPGGIPWPVSRRAKAHGGKTLVDRGNLERSLRYEVGHNRVEIGFDGASESTKHAAAHQFGSHRQTVVVGHMRVIESAFGVPINPPRAVRVRAHGRMTNLPARPMLGIDNQDRRDLTEAAHDYLRGLLK